MAVERFECQWCKITYIGTTYPKTGPRKFCSKACKGESMKKENQPVLQEQQGQQV